jgi:hypothetical protein
MHLPKIVDVISDKLVTNSARSAIHAEELSEQTELAFAEITKLAEKSREE